MKPLPLPITEEWLDDRFGSLAIKAGLPYWDKDLERSQDGATWVRIRSLGWCAMWAVEIYRAAVGEAERCGLLGLFDSREDLLALVALLEKGHNT